VSRGTGLDGHPRHYDKSLPIVARRLAPANHRDRSPGTARTGASNAKGFGYGAGERRGECRTCRQNAESKSRFLGWARGTAPLWRTSSEVSHRAEGPASARCEGTFAPLVVFSCASGKPVAARKRRGNHAVLGSSVFDRRPCRCRLGIWRNRWRIGGHCEVFFVFLVLLLISLVTHFTRGPRVP
jgi:hypothetical protein